MDENDQLRDLVQGLERRLANKAPKKREAKAKERAQREVRACLACATHKSVRLSTPAHPPRRVASRNSSPNSPIPYKFGQNAPRSRQPSKNRPD
jgi:hypothetical protein